MAAPTRSGMRMSAEDRRTAVIAAAVAEFAVGGLEGTSTERIAARAGISQPYLFRLFPNKTALFVAAIASGFARVRATFERASEGLEGEVALEAMGAAYFGLLEDRALLLLQLQGYAATGHEAVRDAVRREFEATMVLVRARTGLDWPAIEPFFARGMLCNVVAALGLQGLDDLWCAMPKTRIGRGAAALEAR